MLHNGSKFDTIYPCKEGEKKCHTTRQKPTPNLVKEFMNI